MHCKLSTQLERFLCLLLPLLTRPTAKELTKQWYNKARPAVLSSDYTGKTRTGRCSRACSQAPPRHWNAALES
uniref:Putative secreted protein n=1 Tax=Amblyomma cajennense TaxID=34607 RepID=A0A023FBK3_AMBCJ